MSLTLIKPVRCLPGHSEQKCFILVIEVGLVFMCSLLSWLPCSAVRWWLCFSDLRHSGPFHSCSLFIMNILPVESLLTHPLSPFTDSFNAVAFHTPCCTSQWLSFLFAPYHSSLITVFSFGYIFSFFLSFSCTFIQLTTS